MASPEQAFESMPYFWCKKAEQYTIDRTKRIITNRLKKVQNDSKIPRNFQNNITPQTWSNPKPKYPWFEIKWPHEIRNFDKVINSAITADIFQSKIFETFTGRLIYCAKMEQVT